MADNNDSGNSLVPVTRETKATQLKWLQARKQELKSGIVKSKQDIEDLQIAKVADLERKIMFAEDSLKQLELKERQLNSVKGEVI